MKAVSAVITTFRRPKTLSRAISSVVAQSSLPIELLVIDNADDRETELVVSAASVSSRVPIKYIVEKKRGVSAARNRGIKEVNGDYIAFLDDDDVWLPNHLADFHKILPEMDNVVLLAGMRGRFSEPETLILPDSLKLFEEYLQQGDGDFLVRKMEPLRRPFFTPSMSESVIDIRKARAVLFDEDLIGREDIYFVWQLGEVGNIVLHQRLHGLADQLEESLFSVMDSANDRERLDMDLRKVQCGVLMLEKVTSTRRHEPELMLALASSYFSSSYFNSLAGNSVIALKHFIRSARINLKKKHFKLAVRIVMSLFMRKV